MKPADYPFWMRVLVVATLIMFVVSLFFFLAPAGLIGVWIFKNVDAKDGLAALGALFGSFFGAWFAFRFARVQREEGRKNSEVVAGNLALFTLMEMWNELRQHQIEIIEPYRSRADAWLNLPVSQRLDETLAFDVKALSFILEKNPALLAEILLEQRRFRLAAYLIEDHRNVMMLEARPRLERAGVRIGEQGDIEAFKDIVGIDATHKLQVMTAAIIKNFDENVHTTREAFVRLRVLLKSMFPDRKFLDFQPNS